MQEQRKQKEGTYVLTFSDGSNCDLQPNYMSQVILI